MFFSVIILSQLHGWFIKYQRPKGVLYRNWWNCWSQRERDYVGVKSSPYQIYQVYLGPNGPVFNISYAEDIEDIYTDKK